MLFADRPQLRKGRPHDVLQSLCQNVHDIHTSGDGRHGAQVGKDPGGNKITTDRGAFSEYHSGADPATGRSLISQPKVLARAATRTRMRTLSTQLPTCRTGGMPRAPQTSLRPGPACSEP